MGEKYSIILILCFFFYLIETIASFVLGGDWGYISLVGVFLIGSDFIISKLYDKQTEKKG